MRLDLITEPRLKVNFRHLGEKYAHTVREMLDQLGIEIVPDDEPGDVPVLNFEVATGGPLVGAALYSEVFGFIAAAAGPDGNNLLPVRYWTGGVSLANTPYGALLNRMFDQRLDEVARDMRVTKSTAKRNYGSAQHREEFRKQSFVQVFDHCFSLHLGSFVDAWKASR